MRTDREAVDILIVGFGFSVIPLLRELERRGQRYTILSDGAPIWQQLAASDRLDFDLVSSFHASFYAQDQVEAGTIENYYPTAREFYEYHERLFSRFRDKVIDDRVVDVENYASHSVVRTRGGAVYEARSLVFATGLGRPQNETIKELDLRDVRGKTIVFNAIGDTTNMMVARAVPQGNRVILLNNGFITLDKYMVIDIPGPKGSNWYIPFAGVRTGKRYALDLAQLECHTVARLWPKFYKDLIAIPLGPPEPESWIAKRVLPHVFHVRFPATYRRDSVRGNHEAKAGLSNGLIGVKYWPIDMYEQRFGDDLEGNIRRGVLVNDIIFYHTEGMVETWSKDRATVDHENMTVSCDGRTERFDVFVDGGTEAPRLPPIVAVDGDGRRHEFAYDHRASYLGVVPAALRNVYFIGYTRPFTGGIANITEMQGLMVHKLLSDSGRRAALYADIDRRIADYNAFYYPPGQKRTATDHLVHFGTYTDDVARFIGIDRKLRRALSWSPWRTILNLRFELLHPNNALKFRMEGEYAVDGAEALGRAVAAHNEHWIIMVFLWLSTLWDMLLGYLCLALIFLRYGAEPLLLAEGAADWGALANAAGWGALCLLLAAVWRRNLHVVNLLSYSLAVPLFGLKASLQPLAMLYIASTGDWYLCLVVFAVIAAVAFAFRQFHMPPISGRYLFADTKYKHKYRPFWERYREAYLRVEEERRAAKAAST
ncbi:MAG: hypothetical protein KC486_03300 [Myxococcales bacterium]|nr:hypothetical protein [Myxococcales bacterium]